jgi:ubiquinone/menaquinone biosynthesis C-methylase UbiE
MNNTAKQEYLLGHGVHEQERLVLQGRLLRPYTERFLRAAGVTAGMRVLEFGCAIGDVALLVADMVGPGGRVTCIDRDPSAIERARTRMVHNGCSSWVEFQVANLDEFVSDEKFDALVGRYILLYQPKPAATIRHLVQFLAPGGVVAFHEVDFSDPHPSAPPCPLFDRVRALTGEAFIKSGVSPRFGREVGHAFVDAGLGFPTIACEGVIGGGKGSYVYAWIASTLISVAPRLKQLGVEIPVDLPLDHTLAAILEKEAVASGSQINGPLQYGVWTRVS